MTIYTRSQPRIHTDPSKRYKTNTNPTLQKFLFFPNDIVMIKLIEYPSLAICNDDHDDVMERAIQAKAKAKRATKSTI